MLLQTGYHNRLLSHPSCPLVHATYHSADLATRNQLISRVKMPLIITMMNTMFMIMIIMPVLSTRATFTTSMSMGIEEVESRNVRPLLHRISWENYTQITMLQLQDGFVRVKL